ncbi:low molecular weight phosphatase family protein [Microvirga sp. W0021]|uniref:Low molecular weight phosphatase family protein n=1 Tax=Hohaiivirga grylli TaxID=3133970 RepID=A0ABV0BGV7_9HYPH
MTDPKRKGGIQSVLFACKYNAIRSPMAEALAKHFFGQKIYIQSAGVKAGRDIDPMAVAALQEIGVDCSRHKTRTIFELRDTEGLNFDLIVTLSPEAHHLILEMTSSLSANVEYWPTFDPTAVQGSYEKELDAYRQVRETLTQNIKQRLSSQPLWSDDMEV